MLLSQRLAPAGPAEATLEATAEVVVRSLADADDIAGNTADVDVILLGAVEPFDRSALAGLDRVQAIVRRGVGVDNVDIDAATEAGILVANVPDASVHEVAEHALSLLLAAERRLHPVDAMVRDGTWRERPAELHRLRLGARRLANLTLGVIGLGRIGRALAEKAAGVYGEVIGADPFAPPGTIGAVRRVELDELLAGADHVSLHLPLTPATSHLIDAGAIARMRDGAVLVNTARGGVVDEAALVAALRAGKLAGAGLDVTEREPVPSDSPLLDDVPGLLLTGHSAAWSVESNAELTFRSVDAVKDLLAGRLPASVVNPEVLEQPSCRWPFRGARGLDPSKPQSQENQ